MEIIRYYPIDGACKKAFITLKIPKWGGFIIDNISYFVKGDRRWINLPQEQYDDNGEKKYKFINKFDDPKVAKAFCDQVLKLIDEYLQKNNPEPTQQEIPF